MSWSALDRGTRFIAIQAGARAGETRCVSGTAKERSVGAGDSDGGVMAGPYGAATPCGCRG